MVFDVVFSILSSLLVGVLRYLTVLLLFVFLNTADGECFLYLFSLHVSSLVKYQFRSFTWFFLVVVYFLLTNIFVCSLYIMHTSLLCSNIKEYFK